MSFDGAPACERHEPSAEMELRTMHSDVTKPDVVVGLYACPECGHERWLPIKTSYEDSEASIPAA